MTHNPPCVLDIGTGYTKMGFAGNKEPQIVIPSSIATPPTVKQKRMSGLFDDLDFHIGDEASLSNNHDVKHVLSNNGVEEWDLMEKFLNQCIFKYLRAEPEDHYFLITEPPLNPPENREYLAEIMFETFNVPGIHIAVQGALALSASWLSRPSQECSMTGVVVDSGDGATHVIPISDGYVISSQVIQVPIGGRHITQFIQGLLRERESSIPSHQSYDVAKEIKERYCYMCPNLTKEYDKYDNNPGLYFKTFNGTNSHTSSKFKVDIGYERFLGPEVLFHPEFVNPSFSKGIDKIVSEAIEACPIDCRRGLCRNIVLSGGSTLFKDFNRRLLKGVRKSVGTCAVTSQTFSKESIEVDVISHKMQRNAVWFGGSMLCSSPAFFNVCHTKQRYEEVGPSICRRNFILGMGN